MVQCIFLKKNVSSFIKSSIKLLDLITVQYILNNYIPGKGHRLTHTLTKF